MEYYQPPPEIPKHKMEPPFPYKEMDGKKIQLRRRDGVVAVGKMLCRYAPKVNEFGVRVDVHAGFTPAIPSTPSAGPWQHTGTFHVAVFLLDEAQTRRIARADSEDFQFSVDL